MNEPNGSDPLDRLRAADPMRPDDVPSASLARVTTSVQEQIMTDTQSTPSGRSRRPVLLGGVIALVGVVALAVALGAGPWSRSPGSVAALPTASPSAAPTEVPTEVPSSAPSEEPSIGPNTGGGGAVASCIRYDASIVPSFDIAFDGTVTAIEGDQVTFDVVTAWKGVQGDTVTLTAPKSNIAITGPAPEFAMGQRYLVSASGTLINTCGYTLPYDAATAASWAAAFKG